MATCKECLHQCYTEDLVSAEETCNFFLDKNKYVELKHGQWLPVYNTDWIYGREWLTGYICVECGKEHRKKSNYCPNCGAKMDGEI